MRVRLPHDLTRKWDGRLPRHSPWSHVVRTAAALAAGMGVGRFAYTPILPLMHTQAALSAADSANLAIANYIGYFVGALAGILIPGLVRSPALLRTSFVVLTGTLAAMPASHNAALWIALRLLAGVASALIFVNAINFLLSNLQGQPVHLPGWAFGGVGAGIALSGLLVLVIRCYSTWRAAWWASAILAALLAAASWNLRPETSRTAAAESGIAPVSRAGTQRWFTALFASYTLEGIGYIVAGTFLVAAIDHSSPDWVGSSAWILVGLAAVPSSALWAWLGRRWSRPSLLVAALIIQAAGIALPSLIGGLAAAMVSAVLFGATFIGVSTLALATGAYLRVTRSVALLTAGYSIGQILGPLVVTPLLHHGYRQALILGAVMVLAAAAAAAVLRIGFPHPMPPRRNAAPAPQPALAETGLPTNTSSKSHCRNLAGKTFLWYSEIKGQ